MRLLISIMCLLMVFAYFSNSPVLQLFHPDVSKDCEHYAEFVRVRNIVYEAMFFTFCLIIFFLSKGLSKAIISFLGIMISGSLIDKVGFKITSYLYSDIFLMGIGFFVAWLIYRKNARIHNI